MDFKRADRVGDQVRAELADIILRKMRDPRVGFVTITKVELSDDLKNAKVFVSVLGDQKQKKDSLKGLRSAVHFIRGELGRRLKLRYMPELVFVLDESIEKGARMLDILRKLEEEDEEKGGSPDE
ncbi:MAG TPA: 30S ribosome-binding factor RbfA [Nitrospirota bacterium]|nr:30S ribosome-binding factor RbfA [Nitrospirota bacterium]